MIFNDEKLNAFSLKSGISKDDQFSSLLLDIVLEVPAT